MEIPLSDQPMEHWIGFPDHLLKDVASSRNMQLFVAVGVFFFWKTELVLFHFIYFGETEFSLVKSHETKHVQAGTLFCVNKQKL